VDRRLHIARTLVHGDGTTRVMREARIHLVRSENALRGLRLPEVRRYLRKQRDNIELISRRLQKT
jgi:hypothetical protein